MHKKDQTILTDLVRHEAAFLKQNASPAELAKLDFDNIDPESESRCIYGQMTGDCYSERAEFLIQTCCQFVFFMQEPNAKHLIGSTTPLSNLNFTKRFPPKPGNKMTAAKPGSDGTRRYFSAIEIFISQNQNGGNPFKTLALIMYLKGHLKSLEI